MGKVIPSPAENNKPFPNSYIEIIFDNILRNDPVGLDNELGSLAPGSNIECDLYSPEFTDRGQSRRCIASTLR